MDRFTWAAVVGIVALCAIAIVSVLIGRQSAAPPDLATVDGVVTAYVVAIQEKRAEDAWALLASPRSAAPGRYIGDEDTLDNFRRTVNNTSAQNNRRIRIQAVKVEGDTARVDADITVVSRQPLWFGFPSASHTVTFSLKREDGTWRITSAPSVWELR